MREIRVGLEDVSKYGMCRAMVLGYVRSNISKDITVQDMAKDFGRTTMCIHRHLSILEKKGIIKLKRGQWMRGNPIIRIDIVGEQDEADKIDS